MTNVFCLTRYRVGFVAWIPVHILIPLICLLIFIYVWKYILPFKWWFLTLMNLKFHGSQKWDWQDLKFHGSQPKINPISHLLSVLCQQALAWTWLFASGMNLVLETMYEIFVTPSSTRTHSHTYFGGSIVDLYNFNVLIDLK